ncbi:MAG TPA: hypothetical protein VFH95_08595 [Candidatus Kapabacteria bacterium]|nr:hypothetical protein [Candidatus Kapabacteria bacterium]
MNDDREHSQPRKLTMHKRTTKTTDGKRQLIFYTFETENPRLFKAGAGGGSSPAMDPPPPNPRLEKAGE